MVYTSPSLHGGLFISIATHAWALYMIERQDTPHGMQYQVVHGTEYESLHDEQSLSEITAIAVSSIPATALVVAAIPPLIATLTPSITLDLKKRLARLEGVR